MLIRKATTSDNGALLQLTRLSPMKGVIALCIDRQPDFFALLKKRGESEVLVAVEGERLAGVFSASKQMVWLNGEPVPVHYVADLKVHPDFRGSTAGLRLAGQMHEQLKAKNAGLVFSTMADGNDRVLPFFNGRAGLPPFKHLGKFQVLQMLPSPFRPKVKFQVADQTGNPEGVPLTSFYNDFFKKYQLGPVVQTQDLQDCRHLMRVENGAVKAAISLMDTTPLKQNVVTGMPWYLKAAGSVSRIAAKVLPVLPLPKTGEAIRMWNIRYLGCVEGHENSLLALVKFARRLAWEQRFPFLSAGFHERDPLLQVFKKIPHISFTSHGMLTSIDGEQQQVEQAVAGIPFEDFALV